MADLMIDPNDPYANFVTPEEIQRKQALAAALMARSGQPAKHWTEALGGIANALIGGHMMNQANELNRQQLRQNLPGQIQYGAQFLPPGQQQGGAATGGIVPPIRYSGGGIESNPNLPPEITQGKSAVETAAKGIGGNETGGKEDPYSIEHPVITSGAHKGDRAWGKYGVMGFNVGPWTKKWYGQELTPQEFKANPAAQEAVFRGQFGEYIAKNGGDMHAAAVDWFGHGKQDQLGTTRAEYLRRFDTNAGGAIGAPGEALAYAGPQGQGGPSSAAGGAPRGVQVAQQPMSPEQFGLMMNNPGIPFEERAARREAMQPKFEAGVGGLVPGSAVTGQGTQRGVLEQPQYFEFGGMRLQGVPDGRGGMILHVPNVAGQAPGSGAGGKLQQAIEPLAREAAGVTAGAAEIPAERGIQTKYVTDVGLQGQEHKALMSRLQNIKALGEQAAYGGPAKVQEWLGKWGVQTKGLPEIEAYKAAMGIFAPLLRPEGSGSMLGAELQNFNNSLGSLMTTPEGRQYAFQIASQVANYKVQLAKIANGPGTIQDRYHRMQDVEPPQIDWDKVRTYSQPEGKGTLAGTGELTKEQAIAELKRRGKWQGQ